jgi:hypothetical protein
MRELGGLVVDMVGSYLVRGKLLSAGILGGLRIGRSLLRGMLSLSLSLSLSRYAIDIF